MSHKHHEEHHKGCSAHEHAPMLRTPLHAGERVITVRAASGLSGDMMLAGLALMTNCTQTDLDTLIEQMECPALHGSVSLEPRTVNAVQGWGCRVSLPHEHAHRTLCDIVALIEKSRLDEQTRHLATLTFRLLAEAEGAVHGKPSEAVTFHEVGALDSILDICMACALFVRLGSVRFICSPLPLADGMVHCAHGYLPTPAPAVLQLLAEVPVYSFPGTGETVTPTAIALLRALGAEFGGWPAMTVTRTELVYGGKVFANAPNGSIWAAGTAF